MKKSPEKSNQGMIKTVPAKTTSTPGDYSLKNDLKIAGIPEADKSTIKHRYSSAYNEWAKVIRFYAHATQIGDSAPVLWLSCNQYKTCRNGHKCFFMTAMTERDGKHEAKWKNMTFVFDDAAAQVQVHAVNDKSEHHILSGTPPKSSGTKTLSLS